MKPIILIGAGGHGKVAADTARANGYDEIAFVDDGYPDRCQNDVWPIIGSMAEFRPSQTPCFLSIGHNASRASVWQRLALEDCPLLAHPTSVVSDSATLGPGTLAVAGSIVNAGTTVGRGAILNTGCSVDHDCTLGDFVHISPGACLAGGVSVGDRSWIGIGAVVCQGITIGTDVTVGAGAVVISDIPDGTTVVGVPARPLKQGHVEC